MHGLVYGNYKLIVKSYYISTNMSTYPFGPDSATIGLICKAKNFSKTLAMDNKCVHVPN